LTYLRKIDSNSRTDAKEADSQCKKRALIIISKLINSFEEIKLKKK
jgi:hypothetical protein